METLRCYACDHEWQGDPTRLLCPVCDSEFIEVACIPSSSRHPPPLQMPDMTLARRPIGRIVSVPLCVLNSGDNMLTSTVQIDQDNPPPPDLFRSAHDHDHDHNHGDDDWAPLGRRNLMTGMNPMGMGGFMSPQNNIGGQTYTYSRFPLPQNQAADRNDPDFSTTEFRRSPDGGSFYFSQSYSYRTPGSGNNPSAQSAQAINQISTLLQSMMGHSMGRPAGSGLGGMHSPPRMGRPPFMGFPPAGPTRDFQHHDQDHHHDPYPDVMNEFWGQPRAQGPGAHQPGDPTGTLLDMMRMVFAGQLNPHNADAATSQQDFDRIMSQLLEQAQQGGGEPPAEADDIEAIPKIKVDANWLAQQEHKECTICMEEAQLGDELSALWCGHWYHPFCIKTWLDAHGACPLCRKTLKESRQEAETKAAKEAKEVRKERRRSSRVQAEGSGTQRRRSQHDDRGARDGPSSSRSGTAGEAPNSPRGGGGFLSDLSNAWNRFTH